MLSDAQVLAAAEAWDFHVPDAEVVSTDEYRLALFPEDFLGFAQVEWVRAVRPLEAVAEEMLGVVRASGRDHLRWWVGPRSEPAGQEGWLRARCGEPVDEVVILALDLTRPRAVPRPPVGVRSVVASTAAGAVEVERVNAAAWGMRFGADRARRLCAGAAAEIAARREARVLTSLDGEPACGARLTVVDGAARLSGGATMPALRGRGAYRDNLETRLALAREWGARLAMVKAVASTSAPLLQRWGFSTHGALRCYRLTA